jgi:hypothetical protein
VELDFTLEGGMGTMERKVLYANTEEGVRTAVIDVTHPAFTVTATESELAAMAEQYILDAGQQREIPEAVREALRNSTLGRALMAASGTFLDGMTTYLLKLGPENLGEGATPIDRRIAASFPAFTGRLRLQDMSVLMAEGLVRTLACEPHRGICLVNIGGGAGADSWNALIHLYGENAGFLIGKNIEIAVLDLDARGAAFGVRASEALCAPEAPLNGLDVSFQYLSYEWSDTSRLRKVLEGLNAGEAACGISSEGGLFEYGSDEEIVSNLRVIHKGTAEDAFVVGSVTRESELVRASLIASRVATRPRTMEAFRGLCELAGWSVERVIERPFSYHVRLMKM